MNGILPGFETNAARPEDVVYTPRAIALDIIAHFKPSGRILDPCRGGGVFFDNMPGAEWCEAREGRDFFAWTDSVDWIVSNPPYSIFDDWLSHSLRLAEHIVYLIPLPKVFNSEPRLREIMVFGGIVETRHYGSGTACGFPFGFPCGAVYIRRGYRGPMIWSFYGKGPISAGPGAIPGKFAPPRNPTQNHRRP